MLTPNKALLIFRSTAVLIAIAHIASLTGSLGLASAFVGHPIGRAVVPYALVLVLFAALPRMRRNDVALAVVGYLVLLGLSAAVLGRPVSTSSALAHLIGVAAAVAPSLVERFRSACRTDPYTSVLLINALDERRRKSAAKLSFGPKVRGRSLKS